MSINEVLNDSSQINLKHVENFPSIKNKNLNNFEEYKDEISINQIGEGLLQSK
jgi:hypothetical protein